MSNLTRYFEQKALSMPKPKYHIGDRVFGYYNKVPFIGSVGNDRYVSDIVGQEVTIHLDLPMLTENGVRSIIVVKHKDIKQRLIDYDADSGLQRRSKTK
jgi:hypothetical protein